MSETRRRYRLPFYWGVFVMVASLNFSVLSGVVHHDPALLVLGVPCLLGGIWMTDVGGTRRAPDSARLSDDPSRPVGKG